MLVETVSTLSGDPAVEGLLILVSVDNGAHPAGIETALEAASVPVFGGLFPGVLHQGTRIEGGAVVVGLSVKPTVTTVPRLSDPDERYDRYLETAPRDHATAFVFVDGFAERIDDFVDRLFDSYGDGWTFLGGGAGSLSSAGEPCLFTNDGLIADGAVLATLPIEGSIGVNHGWETVDGPFRVTAADGTTVAELDGEPAVTVYRRIVEADSGESVTPPDFFEQAQSYPLGISRFGGERIVRDAFSVTDEGGLTCFGDVPEGEFVHILRGEPQSVVDAARDAYDSAIRTGPADGTVFCFDCISRVRYLGARFEQELAAIGGPETPSVGALTIGEIANGGDGYLEHYNKTAVIGVLDAP